MSSETNELKLSPVLKRAPEGRVPVFLKIMGDKAAKNKAMADPSALHVVFQISKEGEVAQQVKNGDGQNCLALTEKIEAARNGVSYRRMEAGCDDDDIRRTRIVSNDRQRI